MAIHCTKINKKTYPSFIQKRAASGSNHLQESDLGRTGCSLCPLSSSDGQQNVSSLAAQAALLCDAILGSKYVPSRPRTHVQIGKLSTSIQIAIFSLFSKGLSEGFYFTGYVALNVRITKDF